MEAFTDIDNSETLIFDTQAMHTTSPQLLSPTFPHTTEAVTDMDDSQPFVFDRDGLEAALSDFSDTATDSGGDARDDITNSRQPSAEQPTRNVSCRQIAQTLQRQALYDSVVHQSPTLPPRPGPCPEDLITSFNSEGEERIALPSIDCWEALSCVRLLNRYHQQGGIDGRGHEILYRMCQIIHAIGFEVAIRKQVKLARAERLGKFQHYLDCLLQGGKRWQKSMKAQIRRIFDTAGTLPYPYSYDAFQDIAPLLDKIYDGLSDLFPRSLDEFKLFARIFEHFHRNYKILYALHREKPDYGLRDVLPTADKVYKLLRKLPGYALKTSSILFKLERVYKRVGERYLVDRARQEKDVMEFNAMSHEEKLEGFKEYMHLHQQGFIDRVNNPHLTPMTQEEFKGHLQIFLQDFLGRVADMIKCDQFHVDNEDVYDSEIARLIDMGRQQRYAAEVKKGWIAALGLDPATLDEDDVVTDIIDIQKNIQDDPELSEDDLALLAEIDYAPRFDERSLAHLLGEKNWKPQHWDLEGAISLNKRSRTLPKIVGLRMKKQVARVANSGRTKLSVLQVTTLDTEQPYSTDVLAQQTEEAFRPSLEDIQENVFHKDVQESTALLEVDETCPRLPPFTFEAFEIERGPARPEGTPERRETVPKMMPFHVSKSFAAIEDDLSARRHQRSSTVPDPLYVADMRAGGSHRGRAMSARRNGVHVPRIFTGSFSQLETEIRTLGLEKVKTPEDQRDLAPSEEHNVRDFAATPRESSPSPVPSPVTLLSRREALVSRETELQNRVINGELVRSRRPSAKSRTQTLDEKNGGIDAWLAQDKGRGDSPTLAAVPPLPPPERQNTL